MCEANAYLLNDAGEEAMLLEMVDTLQFEDDKIILTSIFGEQKIISAKIKEMALVDHRILLEKH